MQHQTAKKSAPPMRQGCAFVSESPALFKAASLANQGLPLAAAIPQIPACADCKKMQLMGIEARLLIPACRGYVQFSLGIPSFPLKCPIAFPQKKLYNANKATKRQAGKGATNTPRPYAGE